MALSCFDFNTFSMFDRLIDRYSLCNKRWVLRWAIRRSKCSNGSKRLIAARLICDHHLHDRAGGKQYREGVFAERATDFGRRSILCDDERERERENTSVPRKGVKNIIAFSGQAINANEPRIEFACTHDRVDGDVVIVRLLVLPFILKQKKKRFNNDRRTVITRTQIQWALALWSNYFIRCWPCPSFHLSWTLVTESFDLCD